MRAAVYRTQGEAADVLEVIDRADPEPGPGEVRVRVAFSGVNPSDVKSRRGGPGRPMPFPEITPHSDGAGVIDAIGAGVPAEWQGRRVWIYNGQWARPYGTAAEKVTLPLAQAVPLPGGTSLEIGASIGIPLMTAFHAVRACGSLLGKTVLVPGAAGSVGLYATQLARRAAARVIASVSTAAKADLARAAGADDVIRYRDEDLVERVRTLTDGRGVDCIIDMDAAGHGPHYGSLLTFGGTVVIYGTNQPQITVPFGPMIQAFATLMFFIVYKLPAQVMRETIDGVNGLLREGSLTHPEPAIYPLDRIAEAHQRVEAGADAKVLVRLAG